MPREQHGGVEIDRVRPVSDISPAAPTKVSRPHVMRPLRTIMAPDSGALLKPDKDAIFFASDREREDLINKGLAEDAPVPKGKVAKEVAAEAAEGEPDEPAPAAPTAAASTPKHTPKGGKK